MFSQSNPFDKFLDNATSANILEVNWGLIMEICDQITQAKVSPRYALNAIKKKILSGDPHVSLYALQLLDACVSNCGLNFHLEVCSREFENFYAKILAKGHPTVVEKMNEYIKRWSEQEFKDNPQLSLIPALYNKLKKEGVKFKKADEQSKHNLELPSDPNVVTSNQEEEDIAKAIELSLKESKQSKNYNSKSNSSSLYPSINGNQLTSSSPSYNQSPKKENYKVRALYDFEAAEDNEITFKAGEILMVLDDSDCNWWKGSNHRGEGLFPSNFVTKNLGEEIETKSNEKKSVQFNEEVRVKLLNTDQVIEIDENKINRLLHLLHEADPTGEKPDSDELSQLEEQCLKMGPLIDQELEVVDKTHASLSSVNSQLVDALNIYCALMKEDSFPTNLPQSPYILPQQVSTPQQLPNNFSQNLVLNPNYSFGQPPIQSPNLYSNPYSPLPNNQMAQTNVPYNHNQIYSTPTDGNQTTFTTYSVNHQVQYGDINSQPMIQQVNQPSLDPNTSIAIQNSVLGQPPNQQMVNYSLQQPTSMTTNQ